MSSSQQDKSTNNESNGIEIDCKPNDFNRFRLTTSMLWAKINLQSQGAEEKSLNQRHEQVATWNKNKRQEIKMEQSLSVVGCAISLKLHSCTFADKSEFKILPSEKILKVI